MRLSVGLTNFGNHLEGDQWVPALRRLEDAGMHGVWLTDHVAVPHHIESRYPFTPDGTFRLREADVWYDALVTLSYVAACTSTLELGIGVCVVGLRHPIILAKQIATIDRLSGGRVALGIGSGWLREEFQVLDIDPSRPVARMEGALRLMKACWSGAPEPGEYGPYKVDRPFHSLPTPAHEIPVVVGGEGPAALRASVEAADGWLGATFDLSQASVAHIAEVAGRVRGLSNPGAVPPRVMTRVPVRRSDLDGALAHALRTWSEAGVDELVLDVNWANADRSVTVLEQVVRQGRDLGLVDAA
ncbi:MAG TPA: TIGR03619 family F420-dependent LLM class oxidoreductase [Egibacteraceae bacterium]|nr:TIGR03619 family F420-dependent LLM class oxidoreductase [Egibacteraceae bacterium]